MTKLQIRLDDLPSEGREHDFTEADFWAEHFATFNLPARIGRNIIAHVLVIRQDASALIRGSISGSVWLGCDRCTEQFEFDIDLSFDEFEAGNAHEDGEEVRIENDKGVLILDIGAVLWEQFLLALPLKPTCSKDCKGVCPDCGVDLNVNKCTCNQDEGDSRLAVFRDLKLG